MLVQGFESDWLGEAFAVVPAHDAVLAHAGRLCAGRSLRAFDAVQLASALAARAADPDLAMFCVLRRATLGRSTSRGSGDATVSDVRRLAQGPGRLVCPLARRPQGRGPFRLPALGGGRRRNRRPRGGASSDRVVPRAERRPRRASDRGCRRHRQDHALALGRGPCGRARPASPHRPAGGGRGAARVRGDRRSPRRRRRGRRTTATAAAETRARSGAVAGRRAGASA